MSVTNLGFFVTSWKPWISQLQMWYSEFLLSYLQVWYSQLPHVSYKPGILCYLLKALDITVTDVVFWVPPVLFTGLVFSVTSCQLQTWDSLLPLENLGYHSYRCGILSSSCPIYRSGILSYLMSVTNLRFLTIILLNKLRCHAYFQFSASITWSSLLIQIHILNGKQCRSRSVGFFRSQLIWIYTVCKDRVYPGSAGQGLITSWQQLISQLQVWYSITSCQLQIWDSFYLLTSLDITELVSFGDNLHDMSNPVFWKNKKNIIISLLSVKIAQRVVKIKTIRYEVRARYTYRMNKWKSQSVDNFILFNIFGRKKNYKAIDFSRNSLQTGYGCVKLRKWTKLKLEQS